MKPSKIHGKSIYICKEKGTDNYYAAYEKGGKLFLHLWQECNRKRIFNIFKEKTVTFFVAAGYYCYKARRNGL